MFVLFLHSAAHKTLGDELYLNFSFQTLANYVLTCLNPLVF
jgi:hypothetical protein